MRFRPYPVMTVFAAASVIVLVTLGNWQWDRYQAKQGQSDLPTAPTAIVTLTALDIPGAEAQSIYAVIEGEPVWRRYVPATIDDGDGGVVLTPWDGVAGPMPVSLPLAGLGSVTRESRVFARPAAKRGAFSPEDQPDKNIWYHFDGPAILAGLGLDGAGDVIVVEPATLMIRPGDDLARAQATENPFATPVRPDPLPPARHLGYALTWWGLALGLIVFYLGFHVSNGRLSSRSKT